MDAAPPQLVVEVTGPSGAPFKVPVAGTSVVIGRAVGCDVQLDHGMVSRQHARLDRLADGRWQVADLRSHNGTLVNGAAVDTAALVPGDLIQIGPFVLTLGAAGRTLATIGVSPTRHGDDRLAVWDDARVIRSLQEVQPPRLAVDQLRCLDEFSRTVLETPSAADRLTALCELMLDPCFGGQWAVAVMPRGDGSGLNEPEPMCPLVRSDAIDQSARLRLSRGLLRAAGVRGEPVIATSSTGGQPTHENIELSIAPGETPAMMAAVAVPLNPPGRGLLYATFPAEYGTGEWLALCALAVRHHRQAETTWANFARNLKLSALEADVERARRVQERLVPKRADLPGLDIAIGFQPCHGVAGDYVDAVALPDGRSLVVVADVSGKGLPAALVAMGLHTLVHNAARQWVKLGARLADLASAFDDHLVESLPPDSFVTLLAMTIDPATGDIEVVNAGHPPGAVYGPDGIRRVFPSDGDMMLGPIPQTLTILSDRLADDETLFLFTDGCFEIFDGQGQMLGLNPLHARCAAPIVAAAKVAIAVDGVTSLLDNWQGAAEASDDRTLLILRRRQVT